MNEKNSPQRRRGRGESAKNTNHVFFARSQRTLRLCGALLIAFSAAEAAIVADVRAAVDRHDLALAESYVQRYRAEHGVTPEMMEALSWLGRGALDSKNLNKAEQYAHETRDLVLKELKKRALDAEPHLPLALGASIEVEAKVMVARGNRSEAVQFLEKELALYRSTSLRTRIQKSLNSLTLEGKPAPPLAGVPLAKFKGHPVLLFFWAHWCPDCKSEVPILARLMERYGKQGLVLIGPTRLYGYMARGEEAPPAEETRYIEQVRQRYYAVLAASPVPVNEENFKTYGASTVPTLVLLDRQGIVRMYHPDVMPYEALAARVETMLK